MTQLETALIKAFGLPTEKQALFLESTKRYVAFGGARGGGKSHATRAKATYLAYEYPGIQILIIRRTLPELRENHVVRLLDSYAKMPESMRPNYRDSDKEFIFPSFGARSSRIKLGYCDKEDDVRQYQGQEYDVLFIDEATQVTEYQYGWLNATVRGVNEFPKQTFLTCNPGGVGHAWIKRLFIERDYKSTEDPEDYAFIKSQVWDNMPLFETDPGYVRWVKKLTKQAKLKKPTAEIIREAMNHADYVKTLLNLPEHLRMAWLDGDWDVFAGQYFGEFDKRVHVCKEVPLDGCKKSAAIDYGLDMFAVVGMAISPEGQTYCYKNTERQNLNVSSAARVFMQEYPDVTEVYAPPDLWNRRNDTGRSAAEIFAESGVPLIKAGNDRVDGWLNVKEYLKLRGGQPMMKIFEDCEPIIKNLPLLQHDTKKPGDVSKEPHDITHSPDALRYWCSRRQMLPEKAVPKTPDPWGMNKPITNNISEDYMFGGY